jgi:pantetheine-phosphate adenylyltransferase
MSRIAIYPGSFDPPTRGHEDLIRRCLVLADRVIVAVAENVAKEPLFTVPERVALLETIVDETPFVTVESFRGLLADFARERNASVVVRGLRAAGDFEYELQMALMNRHLNPALETMFLAPANDLTFVSSTLVREVAMHGGDVSHLVHPAVREALAGRFGS